MTDEAEELVERGNRGEECALLGVAGAVSRIDSAIESERTEQFTRSPLVLDDGQEGASAAA